MDPDDTSLVDQATDTESVLNLEIQRRHYLVLRLVPDIADGDCELHPTIGASDKQSKILVYEKALFRPKRDLEKAPISVISYEEFYHLMNTFETLVQIRNPSEKELYSIKSICKKFWSTINIECVLESLIVDVLNKWMSLFLMLLKGEPADIDRRNLEQQWKVKKWILKILNHLFTRFVMNTRSYNKDLATMLENSHGGKILDCCIDLLNEHVDGRDLPDKLLIHSLQYLTNSLLRVDMYSFLTPKIHMVLSEIIFPLLCFNDKDKKLWKDQVEYVKNTVHCPRTTGIKFLNVIIRKDNDVFKQFVDFLNDKFESYNTSSSELKEHRQKDGALLAFGTISARISSALHNVDIMEYLRSYLIPEITSSVIPDYLRAKAMWVAGKYARYIVHDSDMRNVVVFNLCKCIRHSEYAVQFNSVVAIKTFVEECDRVFNESFTIGLDVFRPHLQQLIEDIFKVMVVAVNTDLIYTIEMIVETFSLDEIAPHALLICQNLVGAFWSYIYIANNNGSEEVYNQAVSAALCSLRAISRTLETASNDHSMLEEIEPILLPIMREMLTTEGREMYEEVLEIISYMLAFSVSVSNDMWSLWPMIADAPILWVIEFFSVISYILQNYILKDTERFLTFKEPDYQQSLWNMISTIMGDKEWKDNDIEPAAKLMETFFQNCKGKVDHWLEPYIRITVERLQRAEEPRLKCLLLLVIGDALYYNAPLTLNILQSLGDVASEIFTIWLPMLQETKKNGRCATYRREEEKKVCCLAMTSLLSLPVDQLPGHDILEHLYKANLDLLVAYRDQIEENAKIFEDTESVDADESSNANDSAKESEVAEPEFIFGDYYRIDSPIDDVDPFILFDDTLKGMEVSKLENLRLTLDSHYQSVAVTLAQYADERRLSKLKNTRLTLDSHCESVDGTLAQYADKRRLSCST